MSEISGQKRQEKKEKLNWEKIFFVHCRAHVQFVLLKNSIMFYNIFKVLFKVKFIKYRHS